MKNYDTIKPHSTCETRVKRLVLFKGLPLFGILIFLVKKCPYTPLCLSKDKTKGHSDKNTTQTLLKHCLKNRVTLLLIFKLIYPHIN